MEIILISGSSRRNSQSLRIARYLAARLPLLDAGATAETIALAGSPLPLWDESFWTAGSALQTLWMPYAERLSMADAFVLDAPEWHGMVPADLKNFLLYCSVKEVGHKPALIVGVSSGRGGAYPVQELRVSSYKNNRICYLPEHLIVRNAASIFLADQPDSKDDAFLRDRADFALRLLLAYAAALRPVREDPIIYAQAYANGF